MADRAGDVRLRWDLEDFREIGRREGRVVEGATEPIGEGIGALQGGRVFGVAGKRDHDPGGEIDRLLAAVDEHGVTLEKILLTHGHIDHVGGTAELADRTGLPVEGPHPGDKFWIDQIEEQGERFGFAGALGEVGLPQNEVPLALLMFNVGVEIGQLMFIATILAMILVARRLRSDWPAWLQQTPAYGIGGISAFWLIERVAGF